MVRQRGLPHPDRRRRRSQVNDLSYGSNNFPASATPGATVNFTYNVTNSGTKAWGANHLLALRQFDYTIVQMGSLATTPAGGSKVVSYSFTAPSTPGTYQYRVQPLENGVEWFGGEVFLTLTVGGVGPPVNGLTYGSTTFPSSASRGPPLTSPIALPTAERKRGARTTCWPCGSTTIPRCKWVP